MYRIIGTSVIRIKKEKGMSQLDLALFIGLKSVIKANYPLLRNDKKYGKIW